MPSTMFPGNNSIDTANGETISNIDQSTSSPKTLLDAQLVFLVLAFVMVAVGIVGNIIIVISGLRLPLTRKKGITTGSRYYIINLALADLGVLVAASVTNLVSMLHPWSLGRFMCKMLLPLRDVFILVSLVTITTLSLERYWLITRPLQNTPNKSVAKFIICCIWVSAYLVNGVPLLLVTRLDEAGNSKECKHEWPSGKLLKIHVCFGFIMILVPFVVVTFCYIAIGVTLKAVYKKRSETIHQGSDVNGNKHAITLILRSKRLVKMLIVVVVTFAITTLPPVLFSMAHLFFELKSFDRQEIMLTFFMCMMVSESAFNPIILLLMASEYRLCIKELARKLKGLSSICCCRAFFKKESPNQPYREILHDGKLPATPV